MAGGASIAEVVVDIAGRTDVGRVREANEDVYALADLDTGALSLGAEASAAAELTVRPSPRGPLLIVCDGMGGVAGGAVASRLATETVWTEMRAVQTSREREVYARLLRRAVRLANRRVWDASREQPGRRGMGTTVSAAGIAGDSLILAQVGDSRAYILRGGRLTQVTRDQSIVSALVQAGQLDPERARNYPQSNIILQALGVRRDVDVALSIVELRRDDRLLLCSDGLHGSLTDEAIASILSTRDDPREAVGLLIDAALAAGSTDNVTAAVAVFTGEGLAPPGEGDVPSFLEFDPMEEGARALATTSRVARRLAARAGIVEDPGGPVVPATGQHHTVTRPRPSTNLGGRGRRRGPAEVALAERARLGLVAWVVVALVLVVFAALLLLGVL